MKSIKPTRNKIKPTKKNKYYQDSYSIYGMASDDDTMHNKMHNEIHNEKTITHYDNKIDKNDLQNIKISFDNIMTIEKNIDCVVTKYNNFTHIWSSTEINNLLIKELHGKIKISDYSDYVDKIVSGDITLFNTETGIMYNGIIYVENNKLKFNFNNRPIMPLYSLMNSILQFNIYIN